MRKYLFLSVCLILILNIATIAFAVPDLQIYIPNATYIGTNSDPWLEESWVTTSSPFELWVIAANNSINSAFLTMAVPNGESGSIKLKYLTTVPSGGSLINEFTQFYPKIYDNGAEVKYPPHGVAGDPDSLYTELGLGTLAAGSTTKFQVTIFDFSRAHFDARGDGLKDNGKPNTFAPFSHDSTYDHNGTVPEPASLSLLGLGLAGLLKFRRKRI